jgi:hypothetical protein
MLSDKQYVELANLIGFRNTVKIREMDYREVKDCEMFMADKDLNRDAIKEVRQSYKNRRNHLLRVMAGSRNVEQQVEGYIR